MKRWMIMVCVGAAAVFAAEAAGRTLGSAAPIVRYVVSPAAGPEIVIQFFEDLSEEAAVRRVRVTPSLEGQWTWIPDVRELHFVPTEGFEPGLTYSVSVAPSSRLFAALGKEGVRRNVRASIGSVARPIVEPQIPPTGKFMDVNIATMRITLFENGTPIAVYPIGGKGNPWLTPTREGNFRILSKEENHWSTIYRLWQPLALRYSGPYFIHAWPYWPNGRRVESVYSGGCVRAYDEDMRKIFDWAEVGMPVSVHATPGKLYTVSASLLRDGDLVREEHDSRVYVLRQVGEKRFKRHVMTERFGEWYPHLAPFWRRVKIVPDGSLEAWRRSRWVRTDAALDPVGSRFIYEIREPGTKHLMQCEQSPGSAIIGPQYCVQTWQAHGWDPDEIFTVSPAELAFYSTAEPLTLPYAAQVSP